MKNKPALLFLAAAFSGPDGDPGPDIQTTPVSIEIVNTEEPAIIQQTCFAQYEQCLQKAKPLKDAADEERKKDLLECKTAKNKPQCEKQSQKKFMKNVSPWVTAITACDTDYGLCGDNSTLEPD